MIIWYIFIASTCFYDKYKVFFTRITGMAWNVILCQVMMVKVIIYSFHRECTGWFRENTVDSKKKIAFFF